MIEPRLLPETKGLIKEARDALRRRGWSVRDPNGLGLDFRAEIWELRYGFICIHQAILGILDTSRVVERLVSEHRSYTHQRVVALLDSDHWGLNFDRLGAEGIPAITLGELPLLMDLDRLQHELPGELDHRQLRLIEEAPFACTGIADRFRGIGDMQRAVQWCRLAVRGAKGNPVPHFKLFHLLIDVGDLEGAHEAGLECLRQTPGDLRILHGMQKLARKRGDAAEAASWAEKRADAERYQAQDFEYLMEKQRRATAAAHGQPPAPVPAAREKPSGSSARSWLSGLFGSGRAS